MSGFVLNDGIHLTQAHSLTPPRGQSVVILQDQLGQMESARKQREHGEEIAYTDDVKPRGEDEKEVTPSAFPNPSDPAGGIAGISPSDESHQDDVLTGELSPTGPLAESMDDDRRLDSSGYGGAVSASTELAVVQAYSGPLPAPADFAAYEQILPGSADRILKMAEGSLDSTTYAQRLEVQSLRFAAVSAALLPYFAAVVAFGFYYIGQEVAGAFTGIAGVGLILTQVISALRRK